MITAAVRLRREPARATWTVALAVLALALGLLAAGTSHAAARVEGRLPLFFLDALHQVAAFVWVGGLFHLVVTALSPRVTTWPALLLPRFSALALAAVAALVVSGAGLSIVYIDSLTAMTGTAYGMMVGTKIVLFGGLLALGAMNFFEVRALRGETSIPTARLRRYVEVEFGLGVTVLLAAASLTSLPPAVDVVADRATPAEVAQVFTPKMPRLLVAPDRGAAGGGSLRPAHGRRPGVVGVQPPHRGPVRADHGPARHPLPHALGRMGAALAPRLPGPGRVSLRAQRPRGLAARPQGFWESMHVSGGPAAPAGRAAGGALRRLRVGSAHRAHSRGAAPPSSFRSCAWPAGPCSSPTPTPA